MKKVFVLFFAAGVSAALFSAELVIADGKTSDYQIVVPESSGNKRLDHFVTLGARFSVWLSARLPVLNSPL